MHPPVLRIAATCKEHCGPQCYEETITLSLADRLNHKKNETWVALSIAEGLYVSRQTLAYDMQQVRPSDQLCGGLGKRTVNKGKEKSEIRIINDINAAIWLTFQLRFSGIEFRGSFL